MTEPLFNARAFAKRLEAARARRGATLRMAAEEARVSPATFSRASQGHPNTSHENVLRLMAWLESA